MLNKNIFLYLICQKYFLIILMIFNQSFLQFFIHIVPSFLFSTHESKSYRFAMPYFQE